jgi:Flp pilus assembly protein TadG
MIRTTLMKLCGDERGASIIELAMTAPFMAAIVVGMTDLARGYSMKLEVEQAAQRTIEKVQQQKSVATSYNSTLQAEATAAMTAAGYSSGNTYDPQSWLECGATTTHLAFNNSCATVTDLPARYVSIRITRNFVPFFSMRLWPEANSDGSITLSAYAETRVQ